MIVRNWIRYVICFTSMMSRFGCLQVSFRGTYTQACIYYLVETINLSVFEPRVMYIIWQRKILNCFYSDCFYNCFYPMADKNTKLNDVKVRKTVKAANSWPLCSAAPGTRSKFEHVWIVPQLLFQRRINKWQT